jgi:hypothetical protein
MTTKKLICAECGLDFEKRIGEYNRSQKRGRKHFCSRTCCGRQNIKIRKAKKDPTLFDISIFAGAGQARKITENSPFLFHMNKVRARSKARGWRTDLTAKDLKEIWDKQGGTCPLTGWEMFLPKSTSDWEKTPPRPDRASLDRIIPMEPYTKNNVRFISFMANMAKNTFSDKNLIDFCQAVAKNKK